MKMRNLFLWLLIGAMLFVGFYVYNNYFKSNTGPFTEKMFLYAPTGASVQQIFDSLSKKKLVNDLASFKSQANKSNLANAIHPGKYQIKEGMSNYDIVKLIKSGRQTPVKLVINKLRTKDDIIHKLSSQLEPDSSQFEKLFSDSSFLNQYGINTNQIQSIIMPNTYELYWNTNAKDAVNKLGKYYLKFWNEKRKTQAQALKLSIPQVITIASIVEEETNKNDEKPKIASVYLNRYRIGMMLGADPTVKFAVGDFTLKRILTKHTQFISPYNTYKVTGLPPGPICTPSEKSIEAVLNPDQTNYIFFCAKEDFSGYHNFATNYADHQANAKRYQEALNKRNIK